MEFYYLVGSCLVRSAGGVDTYDLSSDVNGSAIGIGGQSVEAASDLALDYMKTRVDGRGGVVTVDPQGHWAARFNSLQMAWAAAQKDTLYHGLYAGEHFTQSIDDPH